MATAAYWNWVAAGRPWQVARPVKMLGDRLRGYGYVVYFLGADDESHLQSPLPEDHCPFSATGWPVAHPYPYVTAMDIMPPPTGSGLPSLQKLGAQIVMDRNAGAAGISWLKYANWEPERDWDGACWHDSWQPYHARVASEDRGHIHISGRSDLVTSTVGDSYDPVARIRGDLSDGGNDVGTLDGVQAEQLNNLEKFRQSCQGGDTMVRKVFVYTGEGKTLGRYEDQPNAFTATLKSLTDRVAKLEARTGAASLTDAQMADLKATLATALVSAPDVPLGKDDMPAIEAALANVLRRGVGG